jgi:hypothetical protein
MPIHDWTRVSAGTFHDFHTAWIVALRGSLNSGILPDGYYALAEQVAAQTIPDVLTLRDIDQADVPAPANGGGGVALAAAPPVVSLRDSLTESALLAGRRRRIAIHHASGDRVVALLEIISPGNKDRKAALDQFVEKAAAALDQNIQLLVVDLFPPGPLDPNGIHGSLWSYLGGSYQAPPDKPLTLAAYTGGEVPSCYVEPTSVGTRLIDMPLFLNAEHYVNVPLEETYQSAYAGLPQRWKRVIEAQ